MGWLLAEVAHLLVDVDDEDMIEVAISRSIDLSQRIYERMVEEDGITAAA